MTHRPRLSWGLAPSPRRLTCWAKRLGAPSPERPVAGAPCPAGRPAGAPATGPAEAGAPDPLTRREREVLRLIAAGKRSREIAAALSLSVRTVERHTTTIYAKLEVHNRAEATAYAFRRRLV